MQILIADKMAEAGRTDLQAAGHELRYAPGLKADELPAALSDFSPGVLVVRSTKVSAEALAAAPSLALVVRAGAGVNTIDLATASARGIFVANCPGKNAIAVAELCMGLLLSLDRRIPDAVGTLREGRWEKKRFQGGRGLFGRKLGLIGFGNIAQEFAARALAFGMSVQAWTPRLSEAQCAEYGVELAADLESMVRSCDVLSVHVPLNDHTKHMIGETELSWMPPHAILLHTARGGVVDDRALAQALAEGRVRAGLDVYEGEPGGGSTEFASELAEHADAYGTPHIGASTQQAAAAIAGEVLSIITAFAESGEVRNCVNLQAEHDADWILVVRHLDEVGVLAGVLHTLRRAELNVQQMSNVVFRGGTAASATISLEGEPTAELLAELSAHPSVLGASMSRIAAPGGRAAAHEGAADA